MKKILTGLAVIGLLILSFQIFAQAPQKMSYQAVVRDATGALVTGSPIGIQVSILEANATGVVIYSETHSASTNVNGLMSIPIGGGAAVTGTFASIPWGANDYYIKTEIDPTGGTNYTVVGTSQFMSVPYALYAETSGNGAGPQGPAGNDGLDGADGADGVDGVDGVDGAVGPAGANGLDGLDGVDGNDGAQGIQGLTGATGPAGLDGNAGNVDADGDTKIQVEKNADEDIIRFDLGGQEKWVMEKNALMPMNNGNSVFIGANAGASDDLTNNENVFVGGYSGIFNVDGSGNVATGAYSMYSNTSGSHNTVSGAQAMNDNTTGSLNTVTGRAAMYNNSTGNNNVAMGYAAGHANTIGLGNTFLGYMADASSNSLVNATAIGNGATVTSSNSVQIGDGTVTNVTLGVGKNVLLQTGNIKILDGSPALGKVLTSDADGLASWETPATMVDTDTHIDSAGIDALGYKTTEGKMYGMYYAQDNNNVADNVYIPFQKLTLNNNDSIDAAGAVWLKPNTVYSVTFQSDMNENVTNDGTYEYCVILTDQTSWGHWIYNTMHVNQYSNGTDQDTRIFKNRGTWAKLELRKKKGASTGDTYIRRDGYLVIHEL